MTVISFSSVEVVAAANNAPVLDTPQNDISVAANFNGTIADISGNWSDADGDTLTYSVSPALPAGVTLNTSTGVISGDGNITETASAAYTFTANDGNGGTSDDVVNIEVTAAATNTVISFSSVEVVAPVDDIVSIADLTAGTTATLTTDGATDLTTATTITVSIDGGSAIVCTAVTATTCTFDVPDDGIQLGKTVSVVLTVDGNASNAFSDTFDPALGDVATLAVDWANLHPDSPWYGDATYSGLLATHQIEHAPLTTDGKAVSVSNDGLVTIAGAATDPDHQQFDFAIIGEPGVTGTYPRSNVSTVTIWSPLKPDDVVSIDSIVPTKTGATVTFSYAGSDVDSYEYNIDGGAWAPASSPLSINGQTSETQYTFNIRPINQGSRGDTTSQQYTTNDAVDTTPDAPNLNSVTGAALGSTHQSNVQTVSGVDAGQDVSFVVTGGEWRFSSDGGTTWSAFTTTPGNVRLNYQWQLRGTAHATDYLTDTNVTATLDGTVSDTFTITTKADDIAPTIALIGNATVNLNEGDTYTEQGATWTDNVDGTGAATVGGDTVDTNTVGTYTVTYDYTDAAGNAAAQVTRTVNVLDASAPTITLLGSATVTHAQGAAYNDAGATATDAIDGDLTADITVTGLNFDVNTVGSYTIRYNVSDAQGNAAAEVTRTVNVTDQTAPTITLVGGNVTIPQGGTFNEGYSATDNNDGDITADVIVGGDVVDTNTPGVYTITYDVTDAAGNAAAQVTRTVTVTSTIDANYVDPREVLKVAKSNDLVFLHDGSEIPKTAPKSPNSIVFKGFQVLGLADGENIQQYWVLIEGQLVEPGESVNGLTYESAVTDGANRVKVKLSGGTSGLQYRLTLRFSTQHVPLDERSQDFEIRQL